MNRMVRLIENDPDNFCEIDQSIRPCLNDKLKSSAKYKIFSCNILNLPDNFNSHEADSEWQQSCCRAEMHSAYFQLVLWDKEDCPVCAPALGVRPDSRSTVSLILQNTKNARRFSVSSILSYNFLTSKFAQDT